MDEALKFHEVNMQLDYYEVRLSNHENLPCYEVYNRVTLQNEYLSRSLPEAWAICQSYNEHMQKEVRKSKDMQVISEGNIVRLN